MVRERNGALPSSWLEEARRSKLSEVASFATGLAREEAIIQAALDYPHSNGVAEGQVNRLKMIKRTMVRRVTPKSIALQESQEGKENPGVIGITFSRKAKGKGAFQKSS